MEWCDDAIVIGLRRHGETNVIAELLTKERGRHLGYIHGGRSRRLRPTLQPGNSVRATWQARTDEQMGTLSLEALELRAARIMESALALHGVNLLCALVRLLPEREPQEELYRLAEMILDNIDDRALTPSIFVRLEILLLQELGFGLDLSRCAATGTREDLAYVSPKTGRAVSRVAGEPYRDRILALPAFIMSASERADAAEVRRGFALTEHFLNRDVFRPRGLAMPDSRRAYLAALETDRG